MQLDSATSEHYVIDVNAVAGSLQWTSEGVGCYLILRGPYGQQLSIDDRIMEIIDERGRSLLQQTEPIDIGQGRALQLKPRLRIGGTAYSLTIRHARYLVIGCTFEGEELRVFWPRTGDRTSCDVPAEVEFNVLHRTHEVRSGFLKRNITKVDDGYEIRASMKGLLANGDRLDLWYEFPGVPFHYPITPDMIGNDEEDVSSFVRSPRGMTAAPVVQCGEGAGIMIRGN